MCHFKKMPSAALHAPKHTGKLSVQRMKLQDLRAL